jgi:aldehyde oxidoreductase
MPVVQLTVNDKKVELDEDRPVTLLQALRSRLGVLSPKDGCAPQGVCGCCTVLVNGKPVMACRKELSEVDGAEITTLEGLDEHRREVLARSFAAAGGLQCGYCIPGIAMRTADFLNKSVNGNTPDRSTIAKALTPHICRCTGYEKILDAIEIAAEHWKGDALPELPEAGGLGTRTVRYQGLEATLGLKPYVDDIQLDDMLHGATLLSKWPRAKVLKIDTSAAEAMDGVIAVTTAEDVPGERYVGLIAQDWPVYIAVGEETRCVGDHLASVAATTREIARAACEAIVVEVEELAPLTSPQEAIKDSAHKIHPGGNHYRQCIVRRGDIEAGFNNAHLVLEESFETQRIDQGFLEVQSCVVDPKPSLDLPNGRKLPEGSIRVYTQGQGVHDDQIQLAKILGIPEEQVYVQLMSNGGGFGGKEDLSVQAQAALLATKTGRPVKLTASRDQAAVLHPKRHPIWMDYKMGFDKDGKITAVQAYMIGDTGAYASVGDKVLERAAGHSCGPYYVPAVDVVADTVYTNNLPCGAMRGFGANQACFALEGMMDRAAKQLGLDGFAIREKNLLEVGQPFSTGQIMDEGLGIKETLEAVRDDYYAALKDPKKSVGIGCGIKNTGIGNGMNDEGRVSIDVLAGGQLRIATGYTEMGQGLFTVLCQVVHEETGLPIDKMDVECVSEKATLCGMTTASRATMLDGEAGRRAALKLKAALDGVGGDVTKLEGQAFHGEFVCDFTTKPGSEADKKQPRTHVTFSYATQVVILDEEGKLERVIAAHDVGKVMNRTTCEGQIEGSLHMGLGYALTEDLPMEGGHPLSTNYDDLRILRAKHTPKLEVKLIEVKDPHTEYGAKGVGEIGLVPTAGAVAGALEQHDGIFRVKLPMRGSAAARAILPKKLREEDHA